MPADVEQILVVAADWVHSLLSRRGFMLNPCPDFLAELPVKAFFMDRPDAEHDPSFRQVIPYVLIRHDGKYLTVTRHKTQGESRLHEKMSVGIGGHINPIDDDAGNSLDSGLRRELSEELAADDPPGWDELEPIGLICDDTDDVSKVHLGLVLRWDVSDPVQVRETDKMTGKYLDPDDIGKLRDRLENWSSLVYDGLIAPAAGRGISSALANPDQETGK